ncbi:MAG: hypothetical protein ACPGLY_07695 [Rubripirellula sp.]
MLRYERFKLPQRVIGMLIAAISFLILFSSDSDSVIGFRLSIPLIPFSIATIASVQCMLAPVPILRTQY